jgi:RNA polymerase sigma factor (TIGR02999 family)
MGDVTRILTAIEQGELQASEELLPLVYEELRKLAAQRMTREQPDLTLQPTALVHEAYLRLVDVEKAQHWKSRGHFFAAAAEAMRRILIERARHRARIKHGGGHQRISLTSVDAAVSAPPHELLALDEALTRLEHTDPDSAKLVSLRYFAGLTMPQAAEAMGIPLRTAERTWTYARTWLHRELSIDDTNPRPE